MIAGINRGAVTKMDEDVADALFLRRNPGWRPEDLGYPAGDYIMRDLIGLIGLIE